MPLQRLVQPKVPITARITLFDGSKVDGEFFLGPAARNNGTETLPELLNDNARSFIPFQTEDGVVLLNRTTIRTVEFDSFELLRIFETEPEFIYDLHIVLSTEVEEVMFKGQCYGGDKNPEARRPIDLLNAPDVFLMVHITGTILLLNKTAISHVVLE